MLADSPTDKSSSPSKEQLCPYDNCSLNSSQDLGFVEGSLVRKKFRKVAGADRLEGPETDEKDSASEKVAVPHLIIILNKGVVTNVHQFLFAVGSQLLRRMSVANSIRGKLLSELDIDQLSRSYYDAQKINLTIDMAVAWTEDQKAEFEAIWFKDPMSYHNVITLHKKKLERLCTLRDPRPTRSSDSYIRINGRYVSFQIEFLFEIREEVLLKRMCQANAATGLLLSDLHMIDLMTAYNNSNESTWEDSVTPNMMAAWSEEQRLEFKAISEKSVDGFIVAALKNKWIREGCAQPVPVSGFTPKNYEDLYAEQLAEIESNNERKADLFNFIRSTPAIYERNPHDELKRQLWDNYRDLFAMKTRESPVMPDHEWKEVCDAIKCKQNEILEIELEENRPFLQYYGDFSRVPKGYYRLFSQDVERVVKRGEPHPVMSFRFVEVALFYTPNSFMQLARKWSRKHRGPKFSLMEAKKLACEDFKTMSPALLRYIYIFARVLATPHGTRPGNIPEEQLCHSCWDKGSHYTNECIRNYTRELRKASMEKKGMCGICGQWNVHLSHDVQCSHCFANHAPKLCSSSSMWFRYNIRFFDMWLIYSATMSWTVQDWRNLMDNLIRLSQANPESPNFYRYNFATDGNAAEMNLPVNHEYEDEIRAAMD